MQVNEPRRITPLPATGYNQSELATCAIAASTLAATLCVLSFRFGSFSNSMLWTALQCIAFTSPVLSHFVVGFTEVIALGRLECGFCNLALFCFKAWRWGSCRIRRFGISSFRADPCCGRIGFEEKIWGGGRERDEKGFRCGFLWMWVDVWWVAHCSP